MKKSVDQILSKKILVLDGSLATQIQKYNLKEIDYRKDIFKQVKKQLLGFYELLNITHPEIIAEIHEKYLKVGADIIETNSLRANSFTLKQYEIENISAYELNFAAAKIGREKITKYTNLTLRKPRYLAGSVGPLPENLDFDEMVNIYTEQIKGLLAGKVDFILLETMTNQKSIKAATEALDSIMKKRNRTFLIAISGSATQNSPSPVEIDFINNLSETYKNIKIFAIGENCGLGFEHIYQKIKKLQNSGYYIIAYPNTMGANGKELSLEEQINFAKKFIDERLVNIIGGCCGTGYEYIKSIAKYLNTYK